MASFAKAVVVADSQIVRVVRVAAGSRLEVPLAGSLVAAAILALREVAGNLVGVGSCEQDTADWTGIAVDSWMADHNLDSAADLSLAGSSAVEGTCLVGEPAANLAVADSLGLRSEVDSLEESAAAAAASLVVDSLALLLDVGSAQTKAAHVAAAGIQVEADTW